MLNFNGRLLVCRHGETDWNREHRMQGCSDRKLNETGIAQAAETAAKLKGEKIDVLISSPLSRAVRTAEIIGDELGLKISEFPDEFREREFGVFEGKTFEECAVLKAELAKGNCSLQPPEPHKDFAERVLKGLEYIHRKYSGKNILLVCHAGVIKVLYCYFNNLRPWEYSRCGYEPANCSISRF